ncbi:protein maelstrom homolog [Cryptotermes secundus]|nr:protein maelstrom homolog [Cryptotermes secundus]XP_023720651.1 protein maelstrom homolog [Cryptotermes secundus]
MMTMDNMQQTEKESPEDGFHFFLLHVQKQVQERGAAFISEAATWLWEHMKPEERWAYEEQARNKKKNLIHVESKNQFGPRRRYCIRIERVLNCANRQTRMMQEIEETVRSLKHQKSLKTHLFHLVHVNHYCKDSSGRYLGCEIALAEFSFVDGVRKTFHSFINPGEIPVGYAYLATKRATKTHVIPLPPDAFGSVSDQLEILNKIRLFVIGEDRDKTKLPPLYTRPRDINAVKSVLWQLNESVGPHMNSWRDRFRVYSVCKLFHELRNGTLGIPSEVILQPNFLAEDELINDSLEFTEGISCDFHEEADAMRHCSLSYVQRWSFLIMKECCGFLKIDTIPGKHSPLITHLVNEAKAMYLGSWIRGWNPNSNRHDMPSSGSLSGQPLSLKKKGEAALLQKQPTPQWLKPRVPLEPLRRPRAISAALKLLYPLAVIEEESGDVILH